MFPLKTGLCPYSADRPPCGRAASLCCTSPGTASGPCVQRALPAAEAASGAQDLSVHRVSPWGLARLVRRCREPWRCARSEQATWLAVSAVARAVSLRGSATLLPSPRPEQASARHRHPPLGTALHVQGPLPGLPARPHNLSSGLGHGALHTCLWTWLSGRHILGLQSRVLSPVSEQQEAGVMVSLGRAQDFLTRVREEGPAPARLDLHPPEGCFGTCHVTRWPGAEWRSLGTP